MKAKLHSDPVFEQQPQPNISNAISMMWQDASRGERNTYQELANFVDNGHQFNHSFLPQTYEEKMRLEEERRKEHQLMASLTERLTAQTASHWQQYPVSASSSEPNGIYAPMHSTDQDYAPDMNLPRRIHPMGWIDGYNLTELDLYCLQNASPPVSEAPSMTASPIIPPAMLHGESQLNDWSHLSVQGWQEHMLAQQQLASPSSFSANAPHMFSLETEDTGSTQFDEAHTAGDSSTSVNRNVMIPAEHWVFRESH